MLTTAFAGECWVEVRMRLPGFAQGPPSQSDVLFFLKNAEPILCTDGLKFYQNTVFYVFGQRGGVRG